MNPLRCLIVEDEPLSQEVLTNFIKEIPWLAVDGICYNALEAMEKLGEKSIDLIFLDINMPKLSGIKFARTIENPPLIIFTTAYPEFAVEGFEVDAIDYLVKPIAFDRFLRAVNKARSQFEMKSRTGGTGFITLKSDKKMFKVDEKDILYIQSIGDYLKVYTKDRVIIVAETLKNIEQELSINFIRVHRSYILSLDKVNYIEGNQVNIAGHFLPIGASFREDLLDGLGKP